MVTPEVYQVTCLHWIQMNRRFWNTRAYVFWSAKIRNIVYMLALVGYGFQCLCRLSHFSLH